MQIIFFLLGMALLVAGAELLIRGASSLAKRFNIPEIVIGLTIVAFGTSLPELVVNIFASAKGLSGLAFGNIIGSNIFNILLILGISALINPLKVGKNTVWKEIPFSLFAAILLFILVNDRVTLGRPGNMLTRFDAMIFLFFFAAFIVYIFFITKAGMQDEGNYATYSALISVLFVISGLGLLFAGGKVSVNAAIKIAQMLGVSEKVIGLTIVAAGTSLPELATSAVASFKKKYDIAVGNIVGSNIFNIFLILGISGFISPLPYETAINTDMYVLLAATVLLFISMFTLKKRTIDRIEAGIMICAYIAYIVFQATRS